MKVLSLFSGIGAFEKALDNMGVPCDLVAFCEIDKYASRSYAAIHGVSEAMNLGDIIKVDEKILPKDIDLITYGFPCQDISLAGKQKGLFNADGTQTRSGLFFEALRIIEETQPRVAIAENVKNLTSKKFAVQFKIVLDSLKAAGYNNYWQVLNSKDYGVPQNRERVFIVSIRKDIDNGKFKFPDAIPLELRLKDMLEYDVDEKFYLDGKFETITTVNEHYSMLNGGVIGRMHDISRRVYNADYVAPSLHTCGGGNLEPKVAVETKVTAAAMRGRYDENGVVQQNIEVSDREYANALTTVQKDSMVALSENKTNADKPVCLNSKGGRGGVDGLQPSVQDRVYDSDAIATAVTASFMPSYTDKTRIRKLTPKECFRLMGFDDTDFEKAEAVNSNTQLYKQAGNSIVVDVVQCITKSLLECGVFGLENEEATDETKRD